MEVWLQENKPNYDMIIKRRKYKGIWYHSSLEAKFATLFDMFKFNWQYENFDLPGWSPDFTIFTDAEPLLIETKPVERMDNTKLRTIMSYGHQGFRVAWLDGRFGEPHKGCTQIGVAFVPSMDDPEDRGNLWIKADGTLLATYDNLEELRLEIDVIRPGLDIEIGDPTELWAECQNLIQFYPVKEEHPK